MLPLLYTDAAVPVIIRAYSTRRYTGKRAAVTFWAISPKRAGASSTPT